MNEPSVYESFLYFGDFFEEKREEMMEGIKKRVYLGKWSLEGEGMRNLGEWMRKKENREGLRGEVEGGEGEGEGEGEGGVGSGRVSPVFDVGFFDDNEDVSSSSFSVASSSPSFASSSPFVSSFEDDSY